MLDDFASILSTSDITVITDIYPAREQPIENVNGDLLFNEIRKYKKNNVFYIEDKDELPEFLKQFVNKNTMFLFIGAGNINKISKIFVSKVKENEEN